jgi:hypothetical protein
MFRIAFNSPVTPDLIRACPIQTRNRHPSEGWGLVRSGALLSEETPAFAGVTISGPGKPRMPLSYNITMP